MIKKVRKIRKFYALGSLSEDVFTFDSFNLRDLELTSFIRRKIKEYNPKYDESSEPSRWITPLLILVIVIATFLIESAIGKLIDF